MGKPDNIGRPPQLPSNAQFKKPNIPEIPDLKKNLTRVNRQSNLTKGMTPSLGSMSPSSMAPTGAKLARKANNDLEKRVKQMQELQQKRNLQTYRLTNYNPMEDF